MTDIPPPQPGYTRDLPPGAHETVYRDVPRQPVELNWPAIIGIELFIIIALLIPILIGVFI